MYREYPKVTRLSGWFQVAWSDEVEWGSVKPVHYFGQDLVLYRGVSGTVHVLDAYCPHLGAHLGYGGTVEGEQIICPFHGWKWDASGCNTCLPYADRPNTSQTIHAWDVRERNEQIFVWHDPDGGRPTWEPPVLAEVEDGRYHSPCEATIRMWEGVALHPQFIIDNAVDFAHQKYVHGAAEVSEIVNYEAVGPRFRAVHRLVFGKGKSDTWLTPQGEVEAFLETEVWGMGIAIARFAGTDDALHYQTTTPIDDERCDVRLTVLPPRLEGDGDHPSGRALKRIKFEFAQVDNDMRIWEHQRFVARPPLAVTEVPYFKLFRKWSAQFYPAPSPFGWTND